MAVREGAMALFGEKYLDRVRVVSVGDFSTELCGGTHVSRTGEIGVFKVVTETSSAAGVRRIEAISGTGAFGHYREATDSVQQLTALLRVHDDGLATAVEKLMAERRRQDREIADLKARLARTGVADLVAQAREIGGMKVLAAKLDGIEREQLRPLADAVRQKLGSGLVVFGTVQDGRVALISAATKDVAGKRVHAGRVISAVAKLVGGGGGGRPDMAEAGGKNPDSLAGALERVYEIVGESAAE